MLKKLVYSDQEIGYKIVKILVCTYEFQVEKGIDIKRAILRYERCK